MNAGHRQANRKGRRGPRGTAMVEFVMCIPLIAIIIAAIFFFGWGMKNQQHVKVSDRYKAWRDILSSPQSPVSGEQLNRMFFYERADPVNVDSDSGQPRTLQDLVAAVGDVSRSAESFAEQTVIYSWPRARTARVDAEFTPNVGAFDHLSGPIHHSHSREGLEWRRGQAGCRGQIREQFLDGLDSTLLAVPNPGQNLGAMVRRLYRNGW